MDRTESIDRSGHVRPSRFAHFRFDQYHAAEARLLVLRTPTRTPTRIPELDAQNLDTVPSDWPPPMKPRVFISTVSSELGSIRQLTANVLARLGYEPVWQDIFGTEPGDLKQMLRDKIDECVGLIQIVGRGYGAEPPEADPEFGRVSYTQYELLYARKRGEEDVGVVRRRRLRARPSSGKA